MYNNIHIRVVLFVSPFFSISLSVHCFEIQKTDFMFVVVAKKERQKKLSLSIPHYKRSLCLKLC